MNAAFKLALGAYVIGIILAFLNATGTIATDTQVQNLNVSEDKLNTMLDPATLAEGDSLEVQQESYQQAGFDLKEFVFGSIYIKGTIDQLVHYQWPYTLATSLFQGILYIVTTWFFISWILNRSG
jgi:hypothetical protein